ncbi:hypothetical protein Q3G72_018599 [Acer saccharum]|nr:hypothetical protein Q3G72_018599 [Acer saccharum]
MMKTIQEDQEIRKGPWTEQEDILLINFVHLFGDRRWDFIAKVSGLKVAGEKKIKKFEQNRKKLQVTLG